MKGKITYSNSIALVFPAFSEAVNRFTINGTCFSGSILMQQMQDCIRLSRQGKLDLKEKPKQKGA